MNSKGPLHAAVFASFAGFCAVLAAQHVLDYPWHGGPTPLAYVRDALNTYEVTRTLEETGWFTHSPRLGLPGELDMTSTPWSDNGHMFFLKIIGWFRGDAVDIANTYFFFTFFLAAFSGCWVLELLGTKRPLAFVGGLAFSLLPYHLMRGIDHLYLTGYFFIPPAVWVLTELSQLGHWSWRKISEPASDVVKRHDSPKSGPAAADTAALARRRYQPRTLLALALAVCALVPAFGIYYAFFFAFLLAAQGVIDALAQMAWRPLVYAFVGLVTLLVATLLNLAPVLLNTSSTPAQSYSRNPAEAETYGLKIVQMILPAIDRVVPGMSGVKEQYDHSAPLVSENVTSNLGVLATLAFLATMLMTYVYLQNPKAEQQRIARLGCLTWLCVLYGTVGGVGSLVSYAGFTYIRSINRISVYIAFCSLAAGSLILQQVRWPNAWRKPWLGAMAAAVASLLVVADMAAYNLKPDYAFTRAIYARDHAFFARLEAAAGRKARIFELPYLPFPEAGWGLGDYDHFRPFIHTRGVSFSFGASRGSVADRYQQNTANVLLQAPEQFASELRKAGFDGVLVNRVMAARVPPAMLVNLTALAGEPTLLSEDGEYAYYTLQQLRG